MQFRKIFLSKQNAIQKNIPIQTECNSGKYSYLNRMQFKKIFLYKQNAIQENIPI